MPGGKWSKQELYIVIAVLEEVEKSKGDRVIKNETAAENGARMINFIREYRPQDIRKVTTMSVWARKMQIWKFDKKKLAQAELEVLTGSHFNAAKFIRDVEDCIGIAKGRVKFTWDTPAASQAGPSTQQLEALPVELAPGTLEPMFVEIEPSEGYWYGMTEDGRETMTPIVRNADGTLGLELRANDLLLNARITTSYLRSFQVPIPIIPQVTMSTSIQLTCKTNDSQALENGLRTLDSREVL